MWAYLASKFNRLSIARYYDLKRRLQNLNNRGKDFISYTREFRSVCDQLNAIGKPVDDSMKVFTFLNGLNSEYDPICTVIQSSMSRFCPPSFNDVVSEISGFDNKLQAREDASGTTPNLAFQVEKSQSVNMRGGFHGQSRGSRGRGGYNSQFGSI